MSRTLYLFSAVYPYNLYGDNFLEREVDYLCNEFDHIVVIPYRKEIENYKEVPANATVITPILDSRLGFILRGIISFQGIKYLIPVFFRKKVFLSKTKFNTWVKAYSFLNNLSNRKDIRRIGKQLTKDDVCYFYWGKWGNMLSVVWKGKTHFVSRFHGEWDLWEESSGGYTPLREKVADSLDFAAFISRKGEAYFNKKYQIKRTLFAPLGSMEMGISPKSNDGIVRIFTCSNVIPLKRVPLIFDCINSFSRNRKVIWTHIGGGADLDALREKVSSEKVQNLEVHLLGKKDHSEVIDYYKSHSIDLFINLSTVEGVPVTIMEAISCDVPVVATDVGGVSEIVTNETGVLVKADPSVDEVVAAMEKAITGHYTPREFWDAHYNADRNYSYFAKEISNL